MEKNISDKKKTVSAENTLVDIVLPLYNEEPLLVASIAKLTKFLETNFPYEYRLTLIDNCSTDKTWEIAESLLKQYPKIRALQINKSGRGRAVKYAWNHSDGDVLVYMDVDLSTDPKALEPLVTPLIKNEADIATGTRLSKKSKITRSLRREVVSRVYNYVLRLVMNLKTSDAQCGFKAIRKDVAVQFLPSIKDNEWFFDSELLIKAENRNYRIHEVPVTWIEEPYSRVKIFKTAAEDLKGTLRVRSEINNHSKIERRVLLGIVLLGAIVFSIGMARNGYGNSYYASAVEAGTHSWKAFFFGSLDGGNFITVDKPPLALWLMEISTRIFGFHSWSMMLPNILAGIGTIAIVYASVRRWFSALSALIAAGVIAISPVAVMMFGFNNPDSILTFLLSLSIYAFLRAMEDRWSIFWLCSSGVLVGAAFQTKMLQALIILPIIVIIYLFFATVPLLSRVKHLLIMAIPTMIAILWWPVIVALTPLSSRPFIGSSGTNSIWSLIVGYNGLGRVLSSGQSAASTNPGIGFGGQPGILRMFNDSFGPNIAWFIVLALVGGCLVLWLTRRASRRDLTRIAVLTWMGWLVLHIIIFSYVKGTIHPYYSVVLVPAIAALVGISVPHVIKEYKNRTPLAVVLPLVVALTGVVACVLLSYDPTWFSWFRWLVLDASILGTAGLLLNLADPRPKLFMASLSIAIAAGLMAPIGYSLATVNAGHIGSTVTSGPTGILPQTATNSEVYTDQSFIRFLLLNRKNARWIVAVDNAEDSAPIQISSQQPVMAIGGFDGSDNVLSLSAFQKLVSTGQLRYYATKINILSSLGQSNTEILNYVQTHGTRVNYGGSLYNLYFLKT